MPLFMDRHIGLNATAKSVAEAHQMDLKIQKQFKCKALTYWYEEGKRIAFCLIEAPNKEAVEEMHRNSHGLIPNQIIEVQSNVVEYFLGRIADPAKVNHTEQFINETAFRIILFIDCKRIITKSKLSTNEKTEISAILNNVIRPALNEFDGTEVKINHDGIMASFTSISKSISCALKIQKRINEINNKLKGCEVLASIGLSSGYPFTSGNDFFGETVLLAKRLSEIAKENNIVLSNDFKNEFVRKETMSKKNLVRITNPVEEKFLNSLMELIEKVWNDEDFNVVDFGKKIGLSKAQLYRKIIALTGQSPNDFIKNYRLNRALKLLSNKHGNISEIAFETGFSTPAYFSKCFQKRFGILPSEYANSIT
ncbi:MAG: HTH-type transcriptional activator RhaS [Ignavibacteriaceae bacterium]|nr:HTH-type transcriptional activator RhaS [Ignavibacteriaceae bacterium]